MKLDKLVKLCSPMAQTVWAVLKDQGLNPAQYGFISDGGEDGTYSLQPNELMWMIAKAQQEKLEDLEFRLSALESK